MAVYCDQIICTGLIGESDPDSHAPEPQKAIVGATSTPHDSHSIWTEMTHRCYTWTRRAGKPTAELSARRHRLVQEGVQPALPGGIQGVIVPEFL